MWQAGIEPATLLLPLLDRFERQREQLNPAALLKVDAIAENDGAVERKPRLRAVPGDKLANRVLVGPLAAGGRQAVQHDGLGLATASFTVANSVADPRYPCGVCQE